MTLSRVGRALEALGIQAKKAGRDWTALCPSRDHNDRSPSWAIHDEPGAKRDGYHRCYSCGFQGGLAGLVAEVQGVSVREASAWLEALGAGYVAPIPAAVRVVVKGRRQFQLPAGVVVAPLREWPEMPRRYAEERGLRAWQVDRWGIGYALAGRLAGRLVVVTRGKRGEPRRYTARTFLGAEKRYLEPLPEEAADGLAVFGEQHWPEAKDRERVVVVEGALNGLAVERAIGAGVCLAATAGTSPPATLVFGLATFRRVQLFTDADRAGDALADMLSAQLARVGSVVERPRLDDGEDADTVLASRVRELLL